MAARPAGRPRALVTNACSDPGLVTLRELARAGYTVLGAEHRRLPLGLHSRHAAQMVCLPPPDHPDYDAALLAAVERHRPEVFLPLGTLETAAACRLAGPLAALTHCLIPPAAAFTLAFDKGRCHAQCRLLGIPVPTAYTRDEAEALLRPGGSDTVLIVKPSTDVGNGQGLALVRTPAELERAIAHCRERHGAHLIEEFIPGGAEGMRLALLLFDRRSRLAAAFTSRKLRHWPPRGGRTVVSRSTHDHELVELVRPWFERCGWVGPAEAECKFDPRDGRLKLIEINPRPVAYLRFAARCGVNFPLLTARLAREPDFRPAADLGYPQDAAYVRPLLFLRSALHDPRHAMRDARGLLALGADLLSDPGPLAGHLLAIAQRKWRTQARPAH